MNVLYMTQKCIAFHVVILYEYCPRIFFSFYSQISGKGAAKSGFNWSCEVLALNLFLKVIIAKYFGRDGHAIDVAEPSPPEVVIVVVNSLQTDSSLLALML